MSQQNKPKISKGDIAVLLGGAAIVVGTFVYFPRFADNPRKEAETPSPIECTISRMHKEGGYACNAANDVYRIEAGKNKLHKGDRVKFYDRGCVRPLCDPREVKRHNIVTINGKRLPR